MDHKLITNSFHSTVYSGLNKFSFKMKNKKNFSLLNIQLKILPAPNNYFLIPTRVSLIISMHKHFVANTNLYYFICLISQYHTVKLNGILICVRHSWGVHLLHQQSNICTWKQWILLRYSLIYHTMHGFKYHQCCSKNWFHASGSQCPASMYWLEDKLIFGAWLFLLFDAIY